MARIRSVKPELFSDDKLARLSIGARFLYVGLFTECDDEGRMYASARRIVGSLYPHDERIGVRQVNRWLGELEAAGRVCRYTVDDTDYLHLPNFLKHQKISHPTPSKLPSPSGIVPETFAPDREQGTGNREQGTGIAALTPQQRMFGEVCLGMGYPTELEHSDAKEVGGVARALLDKGLEPESFPDYLAWLSGAESPIVNGTRLTLHSLPKWVKDWRATPRVVSKPQRSKRNADNILALAAQMEEAAR